MKEKAVKLSENQLSASKQRYYRLILDHRENGRKLARSLLRRWRVRMFAEEIDSIVDLTLCEAAQRYSEEKGASFMTFFFYHLRGHLVRYVSNAANTTNVFLSYLKNISEEGFGSESRSISADSFKIDEEVVRTFDVELALFGVHQIETPEHAAIKKEKIENCRKACNRLDQLEQEVINRSFSDDQALVDIAKSLGYSRCHISRVKRSALESVKKSYSEISLEEDLLSVKIISEDSTETSFKLNVRAKDRTKVRIAKESAASKQVHRRSRRKKEASGMSEANQAKSSKQKYAVA